MAKLPQLGPPSPLLPHKANFPHGENWKLTELKQINKSHYFVGVCRCSRLSSRHFPNLCKRQQRKSRLQSPWRALSLSRGKDLRIEMVELFSWTTSSSSPCNLTLTWYSRLACSTDRTRLSSAENLSPKKDTSYFRQGNFNRSSFREFPLRGLVGNSHGLHVKLVQFKIREKTKHNISEQRPMLRCCLRFPVGSSGLSLRLD